MVKVDSRYFRPTEVEQLKGDSEKAFKNLGWKSKTNLEDLISEMIDFDKKEALKDSILKRKGFQVNLNKE